MKHSSPLIIKILRWVRARERVRDLFANPPRTGKSLDPRKVKRSLHPELWTVEGWKLLTLLGKPPSQKHVIFLPGGAYLLEATPSHRQYAEKLAKAHGLTVTLIDYPKSPEHTYRATHELVHKAYLRIQERFPEQEICLLGDSAGGGLALALLTSLRDQKASPRPKRTVLISPWLDLSLSHPQLPAYQDRDPVLPLQGLQQAADLYAGGEDLRHPLLSPLYNDLHDLGELMLVFGTEEIFYPDCQALINKIERSSGTWMEQIVGENLVHAWPIFPFPESREVRKKIADFLLRD